MAAYAFYPQNQADPSVLINKTTGATLTSSVMWLGEKTDTSSMPHIQDTSDTIYLPMVLRSGFENVFKRVVEILVVNFAISAGKLVDRIGDVAFVFLIFLALTLLNSAIQYKLEEVTRRITKQKRIYRDHRGILERNIAQRMQLRRREAVCSELAKQQHNAQLTAMIGNARLPLSALFEAQMEDETVTISTAELLLAYVGYLVYIADVYVAFVLVRIILDRVEGNLSMGLFDVSRVVKPYIITAILYAGLLVSGFRQSRLLEMLGTVN
jgi:hypothetical protein